MSLLSHPVFGFEFGFGDAVVNVLTAIFNARQWDEHDLLIHRTPDTANISVTLTNKNVERSPR